ncbi:putative DEAD/DEAH box helicase [Aspergillus fumigatus]
MDLEAAAQCMTRQPNMQFRGWGESPVVAVIPTGGGKSMLFMVPVFAAPGGTTIIMVLLVALRANMMWRCQELGISCVAWESRRPPVLRHQHSRAITPESAVSPDFQMFLNWLRWTWQLDRIMIDKYHMVWLTATLPPSMEDELCCHPNMAYWVWRPLIPGVGRGPYQWIESEAVVIIYANIISQVTAMAYYSEQLDKAGVLVQFIRASPVITATSVLGMGVDIPNIRSIIHIGTPWILLDYTQEKDQEQVAGYIGVVEGYLDGVVDGEQACDGEGAREAACKSGSMVARQAAREAPCEAGSMVAREGAREAACEAGSMVAREAAREAPCEAGSMVAREGAREAPCEAGSMVAREGAREAACKAGSMVARQAAREAPCEAGSMVAREGAREAACKAGSMVAREGAREAPCEAGSMVAREAASPTPSNNSFCSQPSIPMVQQQHRTQQGLDKEMAQAECMQCGYELYAYHRPHSQAAQAWMIYMCACFSCGMPQSIYHGWEPGHACEYRGFLIPMVAMMLFGPWRGQIKPVWQRRLQGMGFLGQAHPNQEGHSQLFTLFCWLRQLCWEIEVNQH